MSICYCIQANLEDDTTRPSFQDYAETLKVSIVVCEISSMNELIIQFTVEYVANFQYK